MGQRSDRVLFPCTVGPKQVFRNGGSVDTDHTKTPTTVDVRSRNDPFFPPTDAWYRRRASLRRKPLNNEGEWMPTGPSLKHSDAGSSSQPETGSSLRLRVGENPGRRAGNQLQTLEGRHREGIRDRHNGSVADRLVGDSQMTELRIRRSVSPAPPPPLASHGMPA
jgi:hypothetical protein